MEGSYRVERRKGSEKEIDIGEESRRVNFSGSFVWSSRQSSGWILRYQYTVVLCCRFYLSLSSVFLGFSQSVTFSRSDPSFLLRCFPSRFDAPRSMRSSYSSWNLQEFERVVLRFLSPLFSISHFGELRSQNIWDRRVLLFLPSSTSLSIPRRFHFHHRPSRSICVNR